MKRWPKKIWASLLALNGRLGLQHCLAIFSAAAVSYRTCSRGNAWAKNVHFGLDLYAIIWIYRHPPHLLPPKLIWGVQCAHRVKCSEGQFIFWHSLAFLWSLSCRWGVVQLLYSMHASLNCICNAASRRWGRPHWVVQAMFIAQVSLQRPWWMSCKLNWS